MKERILSQAIYWGIWLILPVMVDGLVVLSQLILVVVSRLQRRKPVPELNIQKGISIIVPVYNGEHTLGNCLASVRQQNYPAEYLEVLVVDNGSTDNTFAVFQKQQAQPFRGQMHWISIAGRGKSYALNAGLHLASHEYLCNIDADTVIHPDAMRIMVQHFEADHKLGAATGAIEVLPSDPVMAETDRIGFLIAECEFQEYLSAFWLGRQGQTVNASLFTLAGAFSFFRREVLLNTQLYDKQTVSEDTNVTFAVREKFGGERLACIPEAIIYVTPTPSLRALYAQRVRWQRGELEVSALHQQYIRSPLLKLRGLVLSRTLIIDHTMLFPRLVWLFLFPALVFFGYPAALISSASLVIYAFYAMIALLGMVVVYMLGTPDIRSRLRRGWWVPALMPAYRTLIFVYRLAGSIIALTELAEWRVGDPVEETRNALKDVRSKLKNKVHQMKSKSNR